MEAQLKALASGNRLWLLKRLQEPCRLADLVLKPSRADGWGGNHRPITRQAVRRHLARLAEIGVVVQHEEDGVVSYVVDHATLFVLTQRLRSIATVDSEVELGHLTSQLTRHPPRGTADGPRLILVRGIEEGRSFPLDQVPCENGWLVGRARDADVSLHYDPYVSRAQARILPRKGRLFLKDLETSRNTTILNWEPMVEGGIAPLSTGDLIGVGMSLLMYHGGT